MQVDQYIDIAVQRPLALGDIDLGIDPMPEAVKGFCDAFARRLVERHFSHDLSWNDADAAANNYYTLMIKHCGTRMPDYAWDVFLAFDEGKVDDRGDPFTRARLTEIHDKYGGL
jgi:hypothetical protein